MIKHATAAICLLATPIAVLTGCSSTAGNQSTSTSSSSGSSSGRQLTTQLQTADGKHVADATIDFANGYATITVETAAADVLSPGLHGLHIHEFGRCEGNSTAPSGGESGDFLSAGGHFQAPGHTGSPASGDLPALLVRSDGSGKLVTTTDAFTEDQLKDSDGSSIVLHEGTDTGSSGESANADKRVACGVISPESTSTSVSTSTSTVTTTSVSTVPPPSTVTETTVSTAPSTTTSSAPTSVSTVTQTTITTTAVQIPIPNLPNGNG
jgi:Cu-Zn family superoxide dismutase